MIWILAIIIIPTFIVIVSVAPGKIPPEAKRVAKTFCGLNCAHRGLYSEDQSVPENSLAAFTAAREAGYGVELDVHLTADNKVVVFHDYELNRVCGIDRKTNDMTYSELSELCLFGTGEHIPLLSEALIVLQNTPVIVEIKPIRAKNKQLCKETLEILQTYGQNWCIESFDPRICAWYKRNAPGVLRGQLSCRPRDYYGIPKVVSVILGNLLLNSIARPHFIAYKNTRHPLTVKICMILRPLKALWTANPNHDIQRMEQENDIIIFEHYVCQILCRA